MPVPYINVAFDCLNLYFGRKEFFLIKKTTFLGSVPCHRTDGDNEFVLILKGCNKVHINNNNDLSKAYGMILIKSEKLRMLN